MMTQSFNTNHSPPFLRFVQLNHGPLVVMVLLLLFKTNFSAAQPRAPPSLDPQPLSSQFNPSLAVLMLIIVGAFFCLGFFSVYVRRCADRSYAGGPVHIGGVGRFSRRGQQGLDAAVIQTFPTFLYSTVKGHKIGKGSLECAVCLNEFEDDQTLRLIPKCSHVFHPECIDAWLDSNTTCPVCRANLVPGPGDSAFDSSNIFEPENNSVQPDRRLDATRNQTQNDLLIRISDENDQNRVAPQPQSPDVTPTRPPRSWSTGWRLGSLFPKSRSTGHLLVQPGQNTDRFTLLLPQEIRNQLLNTHLNRTKSCVAFPRAKSSRRGYRSRSGGSWRGKNYFYYQRFDQEIQSDPIEGSTTGSVILRTGSVQSSKGVGGSDEVNAIPSKSILKSIKSPFEGLMDSNSSKNEISERSSDCLKPDNVRDGQV